MSIQLLVLSLVLSSVILLLVGAAGVITGILLGNAKLRQRSRVIGSIWLFLTFLWLVLVLANLGEFKLNDLYELNDLFSGSGISNGFGGTNATIVMKRLDA